jgi:hypothetical protein
LRDKSGLCFSEHSYSPFVFSLKHNQRSADSQLSSGWESPCPIGWVKTLPKFHPASPTASDYAPGKPGHRHFKLQGKKHSARKGNEYACALELVCRL